MPAYTNNWRLRIVAPKMAKNLSTEQTDQFTMNLIVHDISEVPTRVWLPPNPIGARKNLREERTVVLEASGMRRAKVPQGCSNSGTRNSPSRRGCTFHGKHLQGGDTWVTPIRTAQKSRACLKTPSMDT